jgi:hypothetical protein
MVQNMPRVIMHLCDFLLSTDHDEMTKMTNCYQKTRSLCCLAVVGLFCRPGARCLLPWWWVPATGAPTPGPRGAESHSRRPCQKTLV